MPRSDYLVEEYEVGDCKVEIYYDDSPQHPDEGSDDLFLVSFSNDFHVVRKNTWDDVGDFRDFLLPKYKLDLREGEEDGDFSDPGDEPQDNPTDPHWRRKYTEGCDDQIEGLLLASGEDTDFDNEAGCAAALADYQKRHDLWYEWQQYKKAHAEWACFTLDVRNYGGGHIMLALGDIYDGSEVNRWGDPQEPDGFVMVKKTAGWHHPPQQVAEALLKEWQSYCDGEVYGFIVTELDGTDVDSCWGFVGDLDYCKEEAEGVAKYHNEHRRKQLQLPLAIEKEAPNG